MKVNFCITLDTESSDPKFRDQLSALSGFLQNLPESYRPAKEKLHLAEPKTNHPGHGRGGHSTDQRVEQLCEALETYARQNPQVGGLEGRAAEFPLMLSEYGYPNSGPGWWGKDHRHLGKTGRGFECVHYQVRSKDMYRIVWAADKETVSLNNTGRFTVQLRSGEAGR